MAPRCCGAWQKWQYLNYCLDLVVRLFWPNGEAEMNINWGQGRSERQTDTERMRMTDVIQCDRITNCSHMRNAPWRFPEKLESWKARG